MTRLCLTILLPGLALLALPARSQAPPEATSGDPFTVEDYDASIVPYGVPFYTHYPASVYTGFAPRIEDPRRIHFRAGRGNQVRLTAVLDEYAIMAYLPSLLKREEAYARAQSRGMFELKTTEHLDAFRRVIGSPAYGIRETVAAAEAGSIDRAGLYQKGLDVLIRLNPHRVHRIEIDLRSAIQQWRDEVRSFAAGNEGPPGDLEVLRRFIQERPDDAIVLTDSLLFGRINAVNLDDEEVGELGAIVAASRDESVSDARFAELAVAYFRNVTEGRYDFSVVEKGDFVPALQCADPGGSCWLRYPEFTAVYPNGSAIASTVDRHGNTIHLIRNTALMTFLSRRYHDVDHIRSEGYYGYAPKMDWQGIGNGVHNPGVSHHLPGMKHLYDQLGIGPDYQFLWVVSRGPVSSGCIRASSGHLWEIRHIFPSDPERMEEVLYFGNNSADYDVFDIDADGTLEVVGSDYTIAYSLRGPSGDQKRRGKGFSVGSITKPEFYTHLYGEVGQFEREGESYWFPAPHVSYFRKEHDDDKQGRVISRPLEGRFQLHEQPYERDKAQIYHLNAKFRRDLKIRDNTKSTGKQMVRVFGRVNSCGPSGTEMPGCYEAEFDAEFGALLERLPAN